MFEAMVALDFILDYQIIIWFHHLDQVRIIKNYRLGTQNNPTLLRKRLAWMVAHGFLSIRFADLNLNHPVDGLTALRGIAKKREEHSVDVHV